MAIKMIIATDNLFGIGKNNSIPWDCPEDMKYFKEQTLDSAVIMGRMTYESLPFENGLPKRTNYVITNQGLDSSTGYNLVCNNPESTVVKCNLERMTSWLDLWGVVGDKCDMWVIGGASIYQQLLPFVEEIHHTIIDEVYDCDTHFSMEFLEDWALIGGKDLSENVVVNIWRKSK